MKTVSKDRGEDQIWDEIEQAGERNKIPRVEILPNDDWPGGLPTRLASTCVMCGDLPYIDYEVDDDFWEMVVPRGSRQSVLCLHCLDECARDMGYDVTLHLKHIWYTGHGKTLMAAPAAVFYYGIEEGHNGE